MPGTAVKFIVVVLLCVQVMVGMGRPGSTVCFPFDHEHVSGTCDHAHRHGPHEHGSGEPCHREHSPMALPASTPCEPGCGFHIHIPIPDEPQRGERSVDLTLPLACAVLELRWICQVFELERHPPPEPVHDPGGQFAALRSTRLIV